MYLNFIFVFEIYVVCYLFKLTNYFINRRVLLFPLPFQKTNLEKEFGILSLQRLIFSVIVFYIFLLLHLF